MDRRPFPLRHRSLLLPARIQGAHEKGGVEGQIGWFRRNHLVLIPEVDSLDELNAMVDAWDEADDARRIGSRARTVGALRHRAATPRAPSDRAVRDRPLVHPARGQVRPGHGPDEQVLRARAHGRPSSPGALNASDLVVFDGRTEIARHERLMTKGSTRVDLDHYLEVLLRKPGALPGATALEQARASGRFTSVRRLVGRGLQAR